MTREPTSVSPERDQRLRRWQNVAILLMALGVAILVYLAIANTS